MTTFTLDGMLRVQQIMISTLSLENQNGPVERHLFDFTVSPLIQTGQPTEAQVLRLVLDEEQLTLLRKHLLELDLPDPKAPLKPLFQ